MRTEATISNGVLSIFICHSPGLYFLTVATKFSCVSLRCRRAAMVINDVIVAFSGGRIDYSGDFEMPSLAGPHHGTTLKSDSEECTKLLNLATSPLQRINRSHRPLNGTACSSLCVICMAKQSCVVFKPCRHLRCCGNCAERVGTCPICRKQIVERELVYV